MTEPETEVDLSFELTMQQFLHRSAIIKNSGKVLALVVATGKQTKILLNTGESRFKRSSLATRLNKILAVNAGMIFSLAALLGGMNYWWSKTHWHHLYLGIEPENFRRNAVAVTLSGYIMVIQLIPFDIEWCQEQNKLFYTYFMVKDASMKVSQVESLEAKGFETKNFSLID